MAAISLLDLFKIYQIFKPKIKSINFKKIIICDRDITNYYFSSILLS